MEIGDGEGLVDGKIEDRRWLHGPRRLAPLERDRAADLDKAEERDLAANESAHQHLRLDKVGDVPFVIDAASLVSQASAVLAPARDERDVNGNRLWRLLVRRREGQRDGEGRGLHPTL